MKTPDPKSMADLNLSADAIHVMKDIFENKIAFNRVIGLKIDEVSPTEANGHIIMNENLYGHYEHKRIHGGVISAVLDAMGGLAVMQAIAHRFADDPPMNLYTRFGKVGTIDLRIDYLRPGHNSARFNAKAKLVRLGGRVGNTQMEFSAEDGTLIATGTAAYIVS